MCHYRINGQRMIRVTMAKDGACITEEGPDDPYLWNRLWARAQQIWFRAQQKGGA